MAKFKDPNPDWPVAVRKIIDGRLDTRYAHNPKELERLTSDPADGGQGYQTGPLRAEWPKTMSHPVHQDLLVQNDKELEAASKRGYSFEHWENRLAKAAGSDASAAQPAFDPKAQARIIELEKKIAQLLDAKKK